MVTPLHSACLDLLVPSNSLRRLQNLHRMLGVGQISYTFNPSNGAYSSGTLKHFFNLDLHNSYASSERFSNSPVLSVGRGVTYCNLQDERKFYEKKWRKMKDDIERQLIARYYPVTYCPTKVELQYLLLEDLELILAKNGVTINNYNLPQRSMQNRSK